MLLRSLWTFGISVSMAFTSCRQEPQPESEPQGIRGGLRFPSATPLSKRDFYRTIKSRLRIAPSSQLGDVLGPTLPEVGRPEIMQVIMGSDLRDKFKIRSAPQLVAALDRISATNRSQGSQACAAAKPNCQLLQELTAKTERQRQTGKPSDPGSIVDPRFYLWDNWFVVYKKVIYRFTLQSPKIFPQGHPRAGTAVGYDDRHELAKIGLYTSSGGSPWEYQGVVIEPENGLGSENRFDSKVIWSGNAAVIGDKMVVPYTGRSKNIGKDPWMQKIGMTVFDPATQTFTRMTRGPVLDPEAKDACGRNIAEHLGYDLSSSKNVIMAWRDPYLYVEGQKVHMFFAAKKKLRYPREENSAIGHAIASTKDLTKWTLMPPLDLPRAYSQMELPIVIKQGGDYVLLSSVVEFTDQGRIQTLRAYRNTRFSGPWKPFSPRGDLALQLNKVYGINVAKDLNGQLSAVSFDMKDLSLTSLKPISIGSDKITIQGLEAWEK